MDQLLGGLLGQCATHSNGMATGVFGLLLQTLIAAQCGLSPPEMWPQDFAPSALENGLSEYDFVIVGAGTAGSVLANRLTEVSDWKVLLLEAGGNPTVESEVPLLCLNLQNTPSTWNFHAERNEFASRALVNGSYWPSGRVLGGSSSVNAMLYVRGNRGDYDRWEELGNPTWNWESAVEYFKKSEDMEVSQLVARNGGKYHAKGGLMKVGLYYGIDPMKTVIVEAAREKGHKFLEDYNGNEHVGFTYAFGTIHNGRRYSAAKAFLNSARDRPNLHIIKNAFATKIVLDEQNKATGVEFEVTVGAEVKKLTARARKEVIVSSGSVNSAKLLQLSGIGRPAQLSKFNIPVKRDLAVGYNLQDHVYVPIFFTYHKNLAPEFDPKVFADFYYQYVMHQVGLFSSFGITDTMGFVNTENRTGEFPDIQYIFLKYDRQTPIMEELAFNFGFPPETTKLITKANQDAHVMEVCVTLLLQGEPGRVELRSEDPHDSPKIISNYLVADDDVKRVVKGIRVFRELLDTQLFKHHGVEELRLPFEECDKLAYDSDEYWTCYSRQLSTTLYHPVGTAKMGPDSDPEAVVDSRLRVKGVEGLRVIDASIMPVVPRANTNAPTMMVAEKAADFVKQDWKVAAKDEL